MLEEHAHQAAVPTWRGAVRSRHIMYIDLTALPRPAHALAPCPPASRMVKYVPAYFLRRWFLLATAFAAFEAFAAFAASLLILFIYPRCARVYLACPCKVEELK